MLDDAYAQSVGRALWAFAILEWNSAHCCEKIRAGYLNNLKNKTAGMIAADLVTFVQTQRPTVWASYEAACNEFKTLVQLRNRIMHGRPGTAPNGDQRLFDKGVAFDVPAIDSAEAQFSMCAAQIIDMLHNHL
jgi:hypothetical protein